MTGEPPSQVPFQAHVELLHSFLTRRNEIVERIERVLNAQRKPLQYLQDRALLSRLFADCFLGLTGLTHNQSRLSDRLEEAHWASGFRPRQSPGNDLVHPVEMMVRGFHLWQQTRWPGRNARVRYAQTVFNLHVIRSLALLSMRLWDSESGNAGKRLSQLQGVLDQLWRIAPADQPVLVRDVRWLIPMAQSPTTDELWPYFEVSRHVAETLAEDDRLEIHKAGVVTGGGHLRSQLRHYCMNNDESLDDTSVILKSRKSNALDFALLIEGLVSLLAAYEHAIRGGDAEKRLELANAICQGISPDPELFVNRLDLLGPYSMIEHLFIASDADGHAAYTPMGRRHLRLAREYEALIARLAKPLYDDCPQFRPVDGAYSPYGVIYGFSSNLIEHMALKTLQPDAATDFALEDVFTDGGAQKLAWVNGWRKLPHIDPEVAKMFEYPQQFAEDIFDRIERALRERGRESGATDAARTGRLFILPEGVQPNSEISQIADLPVRYVASSDTEIVAAQKADTCDPKRLLHDRLEGYFVLSYETQSGWVAITKDVLTEVFGAGRDAKIVGLPRTPAEVLSLMCPDLAVLPESLA